MKPNLINQINLNDIQLHHDWWRYIRKAHLRVLFVTDGRFTDTNSVYQYMSGKTIGCTSISVKRALYDYGGSAVTIDNSPGANDPHFDNFKFNSTKPDGGKILDDFDVMFIFAVSSFSPSSFDEDELASLHEWMNAGHGVFATGDHSVLGQKMGSRIPRVGTMRKWTDTDGVPPGSGSDRIDTNQPDPSIPGQVGGTSIIPNNAQRDDIPQTITWLPYRKIRVGVNRELQYPHDILCHPVLGPINVMPDHPHEGECFNPSTINLEAEVDFDTPVANKDEYPEVDGNRERPRIIAKGRNSSQYLLAKGAVDPYTFNMISVYDGYKANVGRVVVDSTWHHWFDMNIDGLIATGGDNWEKIGRYFLNVAKYLAPKGLYRDRCYLDIIDSQFAYPFNEEVIIGRNKFDIFEAGAILRETLVLRWGKCGVIRFVLENICITNPRLCKFLEHELIPRVLPDDIPRPDPDPVCLSCPPPNLLIDALLGGVVETTQPIREEMQRKFEGEKVKLNKVSVDEIEKLVQEGMAYGLEKFQSRLEADLKMTQKKWLNM